MGSCSHCWHPQATDSGARTLTTRNLTFDSTVTKRIKYGYPFKAIFRDTDGSLTGKGAETYTAFYTPQMDQPECEILLDEYDGVTCNPDVQIRRIAFWNFKPFATLTGMGMKILKYDDDIVGVMDADTK